MVAEAQIRGRCGRSESRICWGERVDSIVEKDWGDVFSLGEQQLLAVARVLLAAPQFACPGPRRHRPRCRAVALVLKVLSESAITYIVFKGDGDGMQSCDAVLDLGDGGTWQWIVGPKNGQSESDVSCRQDGAASWRSS